MKTLRTLALALSLLLLFGVGCSAAVKDSAASHALGSTLSDMETYEVASSASLPEAAMAMEAPAANAAAQDDGGQLPEGEPAYGKKIIYTAYVTLSADAPVEALAAAVAACEKLGGYVAGSYQSAREDAEAYASATLRVPADQLDALIEAAEALGVPETSRKESDDVTLDYYDISAHLTAAKAEETQLLSLLADCKSVEEILLVRDQLANVREQIESYQARINLWDQQVAYATLELSISETVRPAVAGEGSVIELWQASDVGRRIATGFQNSWRFLLNALSAIGIALAYALLPAAVLGAIVFGIIRLVRWLGRKRREKRGGKMPRG